VLTCATRLAVYISCNQEIRVAFHEYLFTRNAKMHKTSATSSTRTGTYTPILTTTINNNQDELGKMGTDFDRVVIAMVFATLRKASMSHHPVNANRGKMENGFVKKENETVNCPDSRGNLFQVKDSAGGNPCPVIVENLLEEYDE